MSTHINIARMIGIPSNILPFIEIANKIKTPPGIINNSPKNFKPIDNPELILSPNNIYSPLSKMFSPSQSNRNTPSPSIPTTPNTLMQSKMLNNSSLSLSSPISIRSGNPVKISLRKINSSSLQKMEETKENEYNSDVYYKGKNKGKVIYPIFEKCIKLINDDFWINILINFSIGKFKKGFTYKDNYLYYKNKDKIHIDQEDALKALNQLQYFLKNKSGIMSDTDRINGNQLTQQKIDELNQNKKIQWNDIKSSNHKNILIDRYIDKVIQYYNLNKEEILQLKTVIYNAVLLGRISNQIELDDYKIVSIKNLSFDPITRIFSIPKDIQKRASPSIKSKIKKDSNIEESRSNKFSFNKSFELLLKFLDKKKSKQMTENEKMESMFSTQLSGSFSSERS